MRKTFIVTTGLRLIAEWLVIYILISSITGRCAGITVVLGVCSLNLSMFLGALV